MGLSEAAGVGWVFPVQFARLKPAPGTLRVSPGSLGRSCYKPTVLGVADFVSRLAYGESRLAYV